MAGCSGTVVRKLFGANFFLNVSNLYNVAFSITVKANVTEVPEPAFLLLIGASMAGLDLVRRFKKATGSLDAGGPISAWRR